MKTVALKLPAATEDLRKLEIGTVVYLTGRIFTAREGAYKHAIEDGVGMPAASDALGSANFHCSPAARINPDGTYSVAAIPSPLTSPLLTLRSTRSEALAALTGATPANCQSRPTVPRKVVPVI